MARSRTEPDPTPETPADPTTGGAPEGHPEDSEQGTIDYRKSAAAVAKAKARAHDDDLKRLAEEHETSA